MSTSYFSHKNKSREWDLPTQLFYNNNNNNNNINCNWVVTRWQWLFYMYKKYENGC